VEWTLAERFGWTLDYIETLPLARLNEFYSIEDARAKIRAERESGNKVNKWRRR